MFAIEPSFISLQTELLSANLNPEQRKQILQELSDIRMIITLNWNRDSKAVTFFKELKPLQEDLKQLSVNFQVHTSNVYPHRFQTGKEHVHTEE